MNRQIIFRGKRKDNGEWVIGSLLIQKPPIRIGGNNEPDTYFIGNSGFADWNMQRPFDCDEVHSDSIGQFTGLQDKNGKDIYEGDVIEEETLSGKKRYYKIWWEAGGFVINQHQDDFYRGTPRIIFWQGLSDMQTASFIKNQVVIGNVHDGAWFDSSASQ